MKLCKASIARGELAFNELFYEIREPRVKQRRTNDSNIVYYLENLFNIKFQPDQVSADFIIRG